MCILSSPAHVSKTNILCLVDAESGRQYMAYANRVQTTEPGTRMVLAVPNPDTVEFHDLTNHTKLFETLSRDFVDMARSKGTMITSCNNSVRTFSVGSYVGQLYNSLDSLVTHESIKPDLQTFLQSRYTADFGFLAFQLRDGTATYHPFAYSHMPLSTPSFFKLFGSTIKLFVPTLHFHGSQAAATEEFDHAIYLYGVPAAIRQTAASLWQLHRPKQFVGDPQRELPGFPGVRWAPDAVLLEIRGRQRNVDLVVG